MTSPQESLKRAMMATGTTVQGAPTRAAASQVPQSPSMPPGASSMADLVAAQLAAQLASGQAAPGMPQMPTKAFDPDDPLGQVKGTSGGAKLKVTSAPGVESTPRRGGSINRGGVVIRDGAGVVGTRPQAPPPGSPQAPAPQMVRGAKIVSAPAQAVVMRPVAQAAVPSSDPYGRAPPPMPNASRTPMPTPQSPPRPTPGVAPTTVAGAPRVDLTVILTAFERPNLLRVQLAALSAQTAAPKALLVWTNRGRFPQDEQVLSSMTTIRCGLNTGPLERFVFARKAPTEYVAVLDDDVVPGPAWVDRAVKWLEANKETAKEGGHDWVVVCAGEIYRNGEVHSTELIGPESPRAEPMLVDVGRGGFVFRRSLARAFIDDVLGEERMSWRVHIAAKAQATGALQVVLPYETDRQDGWGTTVPFAREISSSTQVDAEAARGTSPSSLALRQQAVDLYRQSGWRTLFDEEQAQLAEVAHLHAVPEEG